jgi:microcystin degradation protein MlrC
VDAVAHGCDGVLLDLHGAMVTERFDDGEGELLARIRRVAPKVPIGAAHDMHANLFPAAARCATALAGYQTYPHVDMYETGLRAGRPVVELLRASARPVLAFGHKPMLPHVMRQSSLDQPNRDIQGRAREMEKQGVLSASFFVGFPHADIPYAGASAVVVADGDAELAQRYCDELLDMAWQRRHEFVYRPEPLERSIARAKELHARPVVLLDHYDNCASGGTMDTMAVLGAILDAGLEDVAAFAVCDPQAVRQMREAGSGARVTLSLGGKTDMPSLGRKGEPREVTGTVKRITDGLYRNEGPMGRGELMDMGATAVLESRGVEIVVVSRQVEPYDIAAWRHLGIDPAAKRYVMLKSRVHWRAGLGDIAKAVVECAGVGVCTSDYSQLNFRRVRRPVYPLDDF